MRSSFTRAPRVGSTYRQSRLVDPMVDQTPSMHAVLACITAPRRIGKRLEQLQIKREIGNREMHFQYCLADCRHRCQIDQALRGVRCAADDAHDLVTLSLQLGEVVLALESVF